MRIQKTLIIAVVATAIVFGGGGFFGGMKYGRGLTPARGANGQLPGALGAAAQRLRQGTGFVNGDILSKDDKSITVKNRDGGSQIIFFTPSTSIGKSTTGTAADLTVGESVTVNGTANSDGTVTATNIQIRPAGEMPFGGPGAGALINGGVIPPTNGNIPNNK
jgi:hypothetical protein